MKEIPKPIGKAEAEPEFAAFIAIDWADQKHYWSLQVVGQKGLQRGTLDNTPEAVEAWIAELRMRLGERPLAMALEQRRGALVVMLSKYAHVHLYPVHPTTLAKFREAWYPSRSKSDPSDADLLLEILTANRSRLRRLDPDTVEMRLLQNLVENRRKLVDERTALSNRLTDLLKLYFPQILGWFFDVTSVVVGDLLEQWPSLQDLQQAKPAKLEKFLRTTTAPPWRSASSRFGRPFRPPTTAPCWIQLPTRWPLGYGRWPYCGTPSGNWKNASPSWRPNNRTGTFSNPYREPVRLWRPV